MTNPTDDKTLQVAREIRVRAMNGTGTARGLGTEFEVDIASLIRKHTEEVTRELRAKRAHERALLGRVVSALKASDPHFKTCDICREAERLLGGSR